MFRSNLWGIAAVFTWKIGGPENSIIPHTSLDSTFPYDRPNCAPEGHEEEVGKLKILYL